MSMTKTWQQWDSKLMALSLRERAMIMLTGLVLVCFPAYSYLLDPLWQGKQAAEQQHQQNLQQLKLAQGEIEIANILLERDPDAAVKQEIEVLNQGIDELDKQLEAGTLDLISAQKMAGLLEKMLANSQALTLVSVESIAPVPLLPVEGEFSQDINLFQHGLTLTFTGSYFAVQDFLANLEQLPDKFYWQSMHYQVVQHPNATVELQLYTLSTNKDFIRG
ncbi:type II secretion system protein GspM [Motilimonas eburnea]|uniref:type II secretion system protein GspM n=1 Tax=Motilimonas eburnea TaxID=1737488 RepID=UPI001E4D1E4B|nr:type II secretion system protein GspM [Motilimonas eburnea]MCE2572135.1 type II secretion system protein M [Motilimonas eburnea]